MPPIASVVLFLFVLFTRPFLIQSSLLSEEEGGGGCEIQLGGDDHCLTPSTLFAKAYDYITANLPTYDELNKLSLGLGEDAEFGDKSGVGSATITQSIEALQTLPWAKRQPMDVFVEYVATYGFLNEPREWVREYLYGVVMGIIKDSGYEVNDLRSKDDVKLVISLINSKIWSLDPSKNITFTSNMTPLIYSPSLTLLHSTSSCTGLSVFLAAALRAAAIPSRIAGTPAWNGVHENGNHNWVEVYVDGKWYPIQSLPAGGPAGIATGGEECKLWFCTPEKVKDTKFVASAWSPKENDKDGKALRFELAWDLENDSVMATDRTDFYVDLCSKC